MPLPPGRLSPAAFPFQVGRVSYPNPVLLSNSADGGTAGQAVTTGNSGGLNGNAFDSAGGAGQFLYDSTYLIHGPGAWRVSTGATSAQAYVTWQQALQQFPESPPAWQQMWFRFYMLVPAVQSQTERLIGFFNQSITFCAGLLVNTSNKLVWQNSSFVTLTPSNTILPTNQWVRLEGYVVGSLSSGQGEVKIFVGANVEGTIPDETLTTTAVQSFLAPISATRLGQSAGAVPNYGPIWFDEWAVSTGGYIGPVVGNPPAPTQRLYNPPDPPGFLSPMAWERTRFPRISVPSAQDVSTPAGPASSTVVAPNASVAVTANDGVASSSVTAPAPTAAVAVNAGVATVASVASPATVAISANAGAAQASASAPAPTVALSGATTAAASSVQAPGAQAAVAVNAGVAVVGAVATPAGHAATANAGVGIVNSVAPPATVSTAGQTNAPAGVAASSAVAPAPTTAVTVLAGVAVVNGAATPVGHGTLAGVASVAASSTSESVAVAAAAVVALVRALAPQPATGTVSPTSAGSATLSITGEAGAHPSSVGPAAVTAIDTVTALDLLDESGQPIIGEDGDPVLDGTTVAGVRSSTSSNGALATVGGGQAGSHPTSNP